MSQLRSLPMATVIVTACALVSLAAPAETTRVEIPLEEIWALDMPGTRNIRDLEPKLAPGLSAEELVDRSMVEQVRWSLNPNFWPKAGEDAGEAFVVVGSELNALREARGVLRDGRERSSLLPAGEDISLVFYAFNFGRFVYLDSVERGDRTITVRYYLKAHRTVQSTTHFALIPLGSLAPGKMRVIVERLPDEATQWPVQPAPTDKVRARVCNSSEFVVVDDK